MGAWIIIAVLLGLWALFNWLVPEPIVIYLVSLGLGYFIGHGIGTTRGESNKETEYKEIIATHFKEHKYNLEEEFPVNDCPLCDWDQMIKEDCYKNETNP